MLSTAVLSGMIILNYLFDLQSTFSQQPGLKKLHMICGTVLIVSGFANIFLIKGKKKIQPKHKLWSHMLHLKFFLALFLTPLANFALRRFTKSDTELDMLRSKFQFFLCLGMYVYSTLIKYYREEVCNNFVVDPLAEKVQKLQSGATAPTNLKKD